MIKYYTTAEVLSDDDCTQPIALKWAKKNGVSMFGDRYAWTLAQKKAFHKRNKKRGRPSKKEKEN